MDETTRRQLDRGRAHYAAGEYDKAARCLVQVVKSRHAFADVYHMLGVIYAHRGLGRRAQGMYTAALKLNPAYTEAAMNLAVSYNEEGRFEEARQVHHRMLLARRKAATLAAEAAEAASTAEADGTIAGARSADTSRAAGPAVQAARVDPFIRGQLANKHAELANAYEQAGLLAEAMGELERALALCPGFVDIRSHLGSVHRAMGNLVAAAREYERVKRENGRLPGPRLQLGLTYYAAGRIDDAAREWREVAKLEPSNKVAKVYLALVGANPNRGMDHAARPARRPRA